MMYRQQVPEDKNKNPEPKAPKLPESVMPTEIFVKQATTQKEVSEVVSPKSPEEQIALLDEGYDNLVKRQDAALTKLNSNETPNDLIDHEKLGKALTNMQLKHAKELEKAATTKVKAGVADETQRISELNQKRLKGYMEAIGEGSKKLAIAVGKGGLSLGKSALRLLGASVRIGAKAGRAVIEEIVELCYTIADIRKRHARNNPKTSL